MSFPTPDNQKFSDKTLKGFLLKGINFDSKNPAVQELNTFMVKRVDDFWETVVEPLRKTGNFDGNKINWYFQIYKEGRDARKLSVNPFPYNQMTNDQVTEIVEFFQNKTLREYLELGTSYLTNTYASLSAWVRDQLILLRYKEIYSSEDPLDWISRAQEEEKGVMQKQVTEIPGLIDVINNIGLIISNRY